MEEEPLLKQPSDRRLGDNNALPPGPPGAEFDTEEFALKSAPPAKAKENTSTIPVVAIAGRRRPSPPRNRYRDYSPDRRRYGRHSPERYRYGSRGMGRDRYRGRGRSSSRSMSRSQSPPPRCGGRYIPISSHDLASHLAALKSAPPAKAKENTSTIPVIAGRRRTIPVVAIAGRRRPSPPRNRYRDYSPDRRRSPERRRYGSRGMGRDRYRGRGRSSSRSMSRSHSPPPRRGGRYIPISSQAPPPPYGVMAPQMYGNAYGAAAGYGQYGVPPPQAAFVQANDAYGTTGFNAAYSPPGAWRVDAYGQQQWMPPLLCMNMATICFMPIWQP